MASKVEGYYCPHCGKRIEPGRLGGVTTKWDVMKLVVIFAGVIGILAVMMGRL